MLKIIETDLKHRYSIPGEEGEWLKVGPGVTEDDNRTLGILMIKIHTNTHTVKWFPNDQEVYELKPTEQ